MTSKDPQDDRLPPPLRMKDNDLGLAVRAYAQSTLAAKGEVDNYAKIRARTGQSSPNVTSIMLGALVGASVTAVVFLFIARNLQHEPRFVTKQTISSPITHPPRPSSAPSNPTLPTSAKALAVRSIQLSSQAEPLPAGEIELLGQARVILSDDALASGSAQNGAADIALQRGNIEMHVQPQPSGHSFSVTSGNYRFTVVGTIFRVSRSESWLELMVREGAVSVSRGTQRLALVEAGSNWEIDLTTAHASSTAVSPPPVVSPPPPKAESANQLLVPPAIVGAAPLGPGTAPPPTPPVPLDQDCRQLVVDRRPQEAVGCFQKQAQHNGLAGETAAYDLARLWRDTLGQPERALTAFEEQRSRFPNGVLRREAELSIIELLPRLNRHTEALSESQRFLTSYPKDESAGELHLLRGNIYREVFHDLDRAQREYAQSVKAKGRIGDDSRFFQAVCLEALGRTDEARQAYRSYIRQGGAAHIAEAEKRLAKLAL